ncbi:energy transducer TonB [Achromobacter pestifer]|uniref:Energy transducer TonB n=1 Tax=Achromobacter pestifer TaxID=1353889 RepID=A0A7D4I254_9BURK|nr:energy transducer TonB [Achromobacter pestifer]QKH38220.1 energy transducer TonB [Achromobacter pestifer]
MNWPLRACTMAAIAVCASTALSAPANQAEWTSGAVRKLQSHLEMPKEAYELDGPLSLRLRLTVLRDGRIDAVELASSSGVVAVDKAAVRMVRRASPLPAFTSDMRADREILMLPVRFQIVDAPASDAERRYANPARGFGVTVPAAYRIVKHGKSDEFDVLVEIASASGTPQAADAAGYLCAVGFSTPRKSLKTHPGAEAPLSAAQRMAAAETILAAQGESPEQRSGFELQGARGTDYVAPAGARLDGTPLLEYKALLDTATLRVAMSCTTTRDDMPSALAGFRKIRDGISLREQKPGPAAR